MNINKFSHSKFSFAIFYASLFLIINFASVIYSHPIDLSNITRAEIGWVYLQLGFTHILPSGLDHILFILGIYLLSPNLKTVIIQATAFTIAHTLTLSLSAYGIVSVNPVLVEPIIAISIMFIAIENIFAKNVKPWRIVIIFIFGLVHGLGFASVLLDLGLPKSEFVTALVTFTIGVELGQIAIILLAYFLIGKWFASKSWYHNRIVIPISLLIAVIALYWTIERIWF